MKGVRDTRAPVLKLPPDLALPALRILASKEELQDRKKALLELRSIPERTMLYAYVLPSLNELKLFNGSLKDGRVTRFGAEIVEKERHDPDAATDLIGRQLLSIDQERVGFVAWLLARGGTRGVEPSRALFAEFYRDTAGVDPADAPSLDRLGKWVSYLVFFRVLKGDTTPGSMSGIRGDQRHIQALGTSTRIQPTSKQLRNALLEAYARAAHKVGSRLYIPIALYREEVGSSLKNVGFVLTDGEIDAQLRKLKSLLPGYTVMFSPFSGPARGGLQLEKSYVGFVSIRTKSQ